MESFRGGSVQFEGRAKEWFGIWIVNLVLTILTIGIYSAWAKVRTKKYFYQNTSIAGRRFDYHATGMQILKGRLIIVGGLVVLSLLSAVAPVLYLIAFLGILVCIPWLLVRSLKFNAQMTSWSNVRFRFDGTVGHAAKVYFLYPILCALTLYTTFPLLERAIKRFTIASHSLGRRSFEFDAPIGPFYRAFAILVVGLALVFVALWFVAQRMLAMQQAGLEAYYDPTTDFVAIAVVYATAIVAGVVYTALIRNIAYNHTSLEGGHKLHSDVHAGQYLWIVVSNVVVVVCTLGLMLPWAQIRLTQYLADHTQVEVNGSLDDFISDVDEEVSAVGDGLVDIEGIDVGLPI